MLDGSAFFRYNDLLISEVFGVGRFNGSVVKIMVNSNNMTECEQYLKRRFTLSTVTKHKANITGVGNYYAYDSVLNMAFQPAFRSMVCKRVY